MRRKTILSVFLAATIAAGAVAFAQLPEMNPTLEFKSQATLKGASAAVTVDALRATQRLLGAKRALLSLSGRNQGKISIPRVMGVAPQGLTSISMALPITDVPDGGIYIVRLDQDKEGWSFDSEPERSCRPGDKSIVFRPSEMEMAKGNDGSYEFSLPHPLDPGKYAIAITNNQYAWGFEVK